MLAQISKQKNQRPCSSFEKKKAVCKQISFYSFKWKCSGNVFWFIATTFVFKKLTTSFLLAIGKSFTVLNIALRNIRASNKIFKYFSIFLLPHFAILFITFLKTFPSLAWITINDTHCHTSYPGYQSYIILTIDFIQNIYHTSTIIALWKWKGFSI